MNSYTFSSIKITQNKKWALRAQKGRKKRKGEGKNLIIRSSDQKNVLEENVWFSIYWRKIFEVLTQFDTGRNEEGKSSKLKKTML